MSAIINSTQSMIHDAYNYYLWTLSLADHRTRGWPLVDSPTPTLLYTILYLLIVWAGPRLMKNRKPFRLTWALIPYNLSMAVLNLYIASELLSASTKLKYSYVCQPITRLSNPDELRIANAVWWYYVSKLIEFCDTFFFILRKKENQLTFLHVYHHSTMFSLWWIGIKWVPSGSSALTSSGHIASFKVQIGMWVISVGHVQCLLLVYMAGAIYTGILIYKRTIKDDNVLMVRAFLPAMANSFIHVLMYTYYGLSALGPHIAKYLWWKKYLTILQLIQFTTAMIMGINGIKSGCDFPLWMQYLLVIYMISFIVLFGNFYAKSYIERGRKALYGDRPFESSQNGYCSYSNGISKAFANGKESKKGQ